MGSFMIEGCGKIIRLYVPKGFRNVVLISNTDKDIELIHNTESIIKTPRIYETSTIPKKEAPNLQ